jgi:hypothetical protein
MIHYFLPASVLLSPHPFQRSAWLRARIEADTDDRRCTWHPAAIPDSETRDRKADLLGKFPNFDRGIE